MRFIHIRNVRGFLSDYYLGAVFNPARSGRAGAAAVERAFRRFRRLYDQAEALRENGTAAACRERFVWPLLRDVLGYAVGDGRDRIYPLYRDAQAQADGEAPLVLAYCGDWAEDLDTGAGSPMRRLGQALAELNLPYGLLVTGSAARLIRQPGAGPQGAYLEVAFEGLRETEDADSFTAFLRLFGAQAFLAGEDGRRYIDEVEEGSRRSGEGVSEDLQRAVFAAAEATVTALLADGMAAGRFASPLDLTEGQVRRYRDAALLALYRLLFIFYAEARDPRLDEHPVYRTSYSAHGLLDEVFRDPARAWPESRASLWGRVRALFRIYDEGLPPVDGSRNIPPRGGDFFSRTNEEGEILEQAELPDRWVASLLLDLATAKPRRGYGRERVSFRELDIENLGSVYEGLLAYEPRIARETLFDVQTGRRVETVPARELADRCRRGEVVLRADPAMAAGTPVEPLLAVEVDEAEDLEDGPAGEAEAAGRRARPATILRRRDPGDFYFAPGSARHGTGSFYTPRDLVRELVEATLAPLVAGRTAAEIERLRVLDPACGSAHFLVEAMRYLGRALHRAYVEEYGAAGPPEFRSTTNQGWDTDWQQDDDAARAANSEARAWCKRRIAERCLYGVDVNPTAVQLARVALWIESVAGDRPLTYFEHHVRCGNAVLGARLDAIAEPPLRRGRGRNGQSTMAEQHVRLAMAEAAGIRATMDRLSHDDLRWEGVDPESTDEQRYKGQLQRQAEGLVAAAKLLFDLHQAGAFIPAIRPEWETLASLVHEGGKLEAYARSRPWWGEFLRVRERERFFHWELEYPEVFLDEARPGFDAVLGNPPFMGGLKISQVLGPTYRDLLIAAFDGFGGTADYCVTFFRRAFEVLRHGGRFGMVGTNTVGQGDSREAGLARIVAAGGRIAWARRFVKWPGDANVEVNLVVVGKGGADGTPVLDGQPAPAISTRLDDLPEAEPKRLRESAGLSFQGDIVRGSGFVLEPQEAERLLQTDPRHAECLLPYLNGEDVNGDPEQRPSRYVICFHDWPLERARAYPALLRIVEENVKDTRASVRQKRDRELWWRFASYRNELRRAIEPLGRVLVRSEVSAYHMVTFVPKGMVYSHMLVVFAFDDDYRFALLQSTVHEQWVWRQASSLESRNRYTPTDCFQTFPFPRDVPEARRAAAAEAGRAYHEHRAALCRTLGLGLTALYHRFHDPACTDAAVARLRELHAAMDRAVAACYGWDDLDLGHDFHENERGQVRFTVSDAARRTIIERLLALNLARAAEEAAAAAAAK